MHMKTTVLAVCAAAALASPVRCLAQTDEPSSPWTFSFRFVYRTFDDAQLGEFKFQENADGYIEGLMANLPEPNAGLGLPGNPTLHRDARFDGQDAALNDAEGIEMTASRSISDQGEGLDFSLTFLSKKSDTSVGEVPVIRDAFTEVPIGSGNYLDPKTLPGYTPNEVNTASLDYDLDVLALTYGLGVSKTLTSEGWHLKGSAGPTVSLVSYEVSRRERIEYLNTTVHSRRETDEGVGFAVGVYARAGAGFKLQEDLALEVGCRYDFMTDVETDFVDFKLSGLSGDLSLTWSF